MATEADSTDTSTLNGQTPTPPAQVDPLDAMSPSQLRKHPAIARLLRGQGSEIEKLQGKISAHAEATAEDERKRLEEQGEFKTVAEQLTEKNKALVVRITEFEKRETSRVERVAAANEDRVGKLPEALRGLVPAGLDPDAAAEHIGKLEGLTTSEPAAAGPDTATGFPNVDSGVIRRVPATPAEAQWQRANENKWAAHALGHKPPEG